MPFTQAEFERGARYQLEYHAKNDPFDQVNTDHPFLRDMIAKKKERIGGNEYVTENIRVSNDSNFQHYFGKDRVTFNEKDTIEQAKYPWYDFHDGFGLDEDRLAANGINITDDGETSVVSEAEKIQLVNLIEEQRTTLKLGAMEKLDESLHLDGTQDPKAAPGLSSIISLTPEVGVVGGIDAAENAFWRNIVNTGISTASAGNLVQEMERAWRAASLYGKRGTPDRIYVGSDFLDAYRKDALDTINRQLNIPGRGGTAVDASTTGLFFKGVELIWDPTFDKLDELYGPFTVPWAKRAYFVNTKTVMLRPLKGHWMRERKPQRPIDQYAHFWAVTGKYSFTTNQRNANAVLSIA
ncbi:phage major capsid protein [Coralloluteibacterium thermophilus]|uniref:Phage major capsid protein n=1 Tax=Coralloluteibacterium thermophilum TaxID=2707049 RepID=A0ABV9NKS4_9GAMM